MLVFLQNGDSAMLSYLYSKILVPSNVCILSARQSLLAKSCNLPDPNSKSLKGEAADSLTYFMTFQRILKPKQDGTRRFNLTLYT